MDKKNVKTENKKQVKINGEASAEQNGKLTYDELNKACIDLSQQNQNMVRYIEKAQARMREMETALEVRRVDYLFEVIRNEKIFKEYGQSQFVSTCMNEIIAVFATPEEKKEENKEES